MPRTSGFTSGHRFIRWVKAKIAAIKTRKP
jgi:hypothetical protein